MYNVWTHVIQSIIKLHTVMFRIKKINSNLYINIQITGNVRSLPWHSGKVLNQLTANHPASSVRNPRVT